MKRLRPSRPPGRPPLRFILKFADFGQPVVIEIDAAAEPDVAVRMAHLCRLGIYDGAELKASRAWWQLEFATPPPAGPRIELRRVVHSRFDVGSVGWSWASVPSDGDGSFFIVRGEREEVNGLDAAYQRIGSVIDGLPALLALPLLPARGNRAPHPLLATLRAC